MPAAQYDLTIEQGATFSRLLKLKDSAGALIDLTGVTFRGQLRKKTSDLDSVVAFTCTVAPNQTTNRGEVTISLTAVQTAALPSVFQTSAVRKSLQLAYDIEMVNGSQVTRIMQGVANVSPEVTK